MAAAQMHSEGRLLPESQIDDRRDQTPEQLKSAMAADAFRNATTQPAPLEDKSNTAMAQDLGINQIKGSELKVYDWTGKKLKKDQ